TPAPMMVQSILSTALHVHAMWPMSRASTKALCSKREGVAHGISDALDELIKQKFTLLRRGAFSRRQKAGSRPLRGIDWKEIIRRIDDRRLIGKRVQRDELGPEVEPHPPRHDARK